VALQHRYYIPLAIFMSFTVPTLIGLIWGAPLGGLIFGGALRVLLTQQSTFFVNSLSHTLGKRTYSADISARDSLIVAFLTHGEGYHNFHHRFQADYRNGIKWYHWDPTKWTIKFLAFAGLAKRLRKISETEIFKARLQMDALYLRSKGFSEETLEALKTRILAAQESVKALRAEVKRLRQNFSSSSFEQVAQLRAELSWRRRDFRHQWRRWRRLKRLAAPIAVS